MHKFYKQNSSLFYYERGIVSIVDALMEFSSLHPVVQALIGTTFGWFMTAIGALTVIFFKKVDKKLLDVMLGFGAGVMIAASF